MNCRHRRAGSTWGEVTVRGAAELRVKESDRIATLVAAFARSVSMPRNGRTASRFAEHRPARDARRTSAADARGDHRMAMAFAIAALAADRPCRIEGADSVAISYPDFFATLDRLRAS
jgi:3-phosphoshikimate 1-carboxyvinyltransferase